MFPCYLRNLASAPPGVNVLKQVDYSPVRLPRSPVHSVRKIVCGQNQPSSLADFYSPWHRRGEGLRETVIELYQ